MSDLISRQAAIDEIMETFAKSLARQRAIEAIENVPAKRNVVLCKDCGWWTKQPDSPQGRCARYGFYPTGGWYCAGAERRDE